MVDVRCDHGEEDGAQRHRTCESCGAVMKLAYIMPGQPGHEVRTWRCPICREEEIDRVEIG